jgi:sarcosine oxidase
MKHNYDYIVLGLGGVGSGAVYWLSRQAGQKVLGLEQFEIGHVRGGSQDHSRIIRLSYHTPGYVELAQSAYRAWATLEADAGEKLIVKTGGLDLAPPNAAYPLTDYSDSMQVCGVPFERLTAAEVMRRWPQFQLTDDIEGLYQADGGIAPAAKCNAAHVRLAREYGATLLANLPVSSIREVGGEIELVAGGQSFYCGKLIITAGAWTNNALAHFGLKLPLTVTQEQVTYFASPHAADFMPDRFPIWIWMDEPSFYGFPVYGENGPKVAQDCGGREVTAETRSFEPEPDNFRRVENFMKRYLPSAWGPVIYTKTCLYTMPPDRNFVIDTLPERPHISVAVGAGHAFKFASLIGQILSELAANGSTGHNIQPFQFDRPIMFEENPVRSYAA